jgi:hypothetical protein
MTWGSSDAERVAERLLSGTGDRWAHVRLVAKSVQDLAGASGGQLDALVAAAWLHDVGYAPELVVTGMHALDGAVYLARRGTPAEVVSLVAFHTGAEYEAEERGLVDELGGIERPAQEDLDLLILADLVSGPSGERMTIQDRLDGIMARYEPEHPVHRAVTRSRSYLESCCGRAARQVGYPMKGAGLRSR